VAKEAKVGSWWSRSGARWPYNPRLGRLTDQHKPPGYVDAAGGVNPLETDHQSRDVFRRLIYGA
jgi:ABC-type dipeptide/oligopeptide/nickel transport system permease subunit